MFKGFCNSVNFMNVLLQMNVHLVIDDEFFERIVVMIKPSQHESVQQRSEFRWRAKRDPL